MVNKTDASGLFTDTVLSKTVSTGGISFGRTVANGSQRAFRFTPSLNAWVCRISVRGESNIGSPSDGINMTVVSGGSNPGLGSSVLTMYLQNIDWTSQVVTFDLPYCIAVPKTTNVWFVFSRAGSLSDVAYPTIGYNSAVSGDATSSLYVYTGSWTDNNKMPYLVVYGSTNLVDTVSIDVLSLTPTSTSVTYRCPDLGLFTSLCDGVVWAVVPDWSQLDGIFSTVSSTVSTKFPFTYISSFRYALTQNPTTSSLPLVSVSTLGFAPTTSTFGSFLPSTLNLFSASTVQQYIPSSTWTILRLLFALVFYAAAAETVYLGATHLFNRNK